MRRIAIVLSGLAASIAAACAPVQPHYGASGPVPNTVPYRAPVTRTASVTPTGEPSTFDAPASVNRAPTSMTRAPASATPSASPAAAPGPTAYGPPTDATYAPGQFRFAFQVGDEMAVTVWKEKELETTQRIQRDGTISPMLLGTIVVAGKTVDEVRHDLEQRYTEYLQEPKVSVRVVSIHSERVFVLGEVKTPAAITLNGPTTLTQALAQAGGFTQEFADQQRVRIVRTGPDGKPALITANVSAMLTGNVPIVQVMPGDVVYVPPTGLASWSRGLGQALGPISGLISAAGGIITSYAAIKTLDNNN